MVLLGIGVPQQAEYREEEVVMFEHIYACGRSQGYIVRGGAPSCMARSCSTPGWCRGSGKQGRSNDDPERIILTKTDVPQAIFPVTPPLKPRVGPPLGRVQLLKEQENKKERW